MNRFDLRNDLAVQAAKTLDAKIEAAIREAFDEGMDFVRSSTLEWNVQTDYMAPRPLHEPWVHVIAYRGGPIAPDAETPVDMVRYARPKDWRRGQGLR